MNDRRKAAVFTNSTRKHLVRLGFALGVVSAAMGATTGTAAFQDIADMTNTSESLDARWMVRLASLPQGSVHSIAGLRSGSSIGALTHRMGVQTADGWRDLHDDQHSAAASAQTIVSAATGDWGVETSKETPFQLASLRDSGMFDPTSYASGFAPESLFVAGDDLVTQVADRLAGENSRPDVLDEGFGVNIAKAEAERLPVQMVAEARAAARHMTKIVEDARENNFAPSTLAAYAPQEKDVATAFSELLAANRSNTKIVLAKGDHKWAAAPLPASTGTKRAHECLAKGVYFEARGESRDGQKAVAQVILNRVKNPAYPDTICGVVFQNEKMRNACQFSFACDGIRDRVSGGKHWKTAKKIARDAIEGRFWLKSVGSSSHYHADYVAPKWRRSMKRMVKIGRHIFYRTYGGGWS
jgi:spore germination cell wall hydrolase CwlJ-like protein